MVVELRQPGVERPVRQLGVPVKLSRTPGDPARGPGPALGEHTDAVLAGLGFSAEDVDAMKAAGAVAGPEAGDAESFLG
jgi:crotonobetainyl-CoA:carnitine CoA-transferase CaiB-like acyl-CoA transferase